MHQQWWAVFYKETWGPIFEPIVDWELTEDGVTALALSIYDGFPMPLCDRFAGGDKYLRATLLLTDAQFSDLMIKLTEGHREHEGAKR